MLNKLKQLKEEIYAKAAATVGIAAILSLAFMMGCQQTSKTHRNSGEF